MRSRGYNRQALLASNTNFGVRSQPTYGNTAFQGLIKDLWPAHPMAKSNGAAYGTEFKAYVWPILQRAGAKMVSQKPNKYQLP